MTVNSIFEWNPASKRFFPIKHHSPLEPPLEEKLQSILSQIARKSGLLRPNWPFILLALALLALPAALLLSLLLKTPLWAFLLILALFGAFLLLSVGLAAYYLSQDRVKLVNDYMMDNKPRLEDSLTAEGLKLAYRFGNSRI